MAPEIMNGEKYNERVDVYSFAMLLYEVLSNDLPFARELKAEMNSFAMAVKVANVSPFNAHVAHRAKKEHTTNSPSLYRLGSVRLCPRTSGIQS